MGSVNAVPCCSHEIEQTVTADIKTALNPRCESALPLGSPQGFHGFAKVAIGTLNIRFLLRDVIAEHVRVEGKATLTFDAGDGSSIELTFTKAPLGIYFKDSSPIEITRVASHGEGRALGIQKGWKLTHLQGYPMESIEFELAVALLGAVTFALPSA